MKKISRPLIFGIICFLLSFAITLQVRFTSTSNSTTSKKKISDELKDKIFLLNNENDKLSNKLEKLEKNLESVRDSAAENDVVSKQKSELIKKYTIAAGFTDVYGEGIIIKYIPAENTYNSDITKDLIDIVNELKNAGAEAISINNQRLINTSSVEMVKNKIIINDTELNSPFIIKAIGNSETINSSLIRPEGTIQFIKNTGVKIELTISKNVTISKYSEI